ncbi:unnamed protein product [Triticum turgidum subsp. durum]|uniref:J domain-containing protein n=1 Tax=Triticum turgidum subsp. durum TaxID=4567 RepID=A0A9R0TJ38_TRITD|nr:unnamed protein product [Triticum turgidum subsp. durum]
MTIADRLLVPTHPAANAPPTPPAARASDASPPAATAPTGSFIPQRNHRPQLLFLNRTYSQILKRANRVGSSEVKAAYEKRCEQLNKQGLEEEEISKEHDLLKESFTILSTEEERRLYDWSLARNGQPERYVWPFEVDPMELAPDPPKEPEDEFPTKLVGYFLLTWFIISVACSLILNRS